MLEGDFDDSLTVDKKESDIGPGKAGQRVAFPIGQVSVEDLAGLGEDLGEGHTVEEDQKDKRIAGRGRGLNDPGGND